MNTVYRNKKLLKHTVAPENGLQPTMDYSLQTRIELIAENWSIHNLCLQSLTKLYLN